MIAMDRLQPEREKMIVYPIRITKGQYEKVTKVARFLGVNRTAALRAMIDAVTVDDTPAADHAANRDDVEQELANG